MNGVYKTNIDCSFIRGMVENYCTLGEIQVHHLGLLFTSALLASVNSRPRLNFTSGTIIFHYSPHEQSSLVYYRVLIVQPFKYWYLLLIKQSFKYCYLLPIAHSFKYCYLLLKAILQKKTKNTSIKRKQTKKQTKHNITKQTNKKQNKTEQKTVL